jgi:hypothetical protein
LKGIGIAPFQRRKINEYLILKFTKFHFVKRDNSSLLCVLELGRAVSLRKL